MDVIFNREEQGLGDLSKTSIEHRDFNRSSTEKKQFRKSSLKNVGLTQSGIYFWNKIPPWIENLRRSSV